MRPASKWNTGRLAMTALLIAALAGCDLFTAKRATQYEVIYIDGCALLVKASDLEQFNERDIDWAMGEDCSVSRDGRTTVVPTLRAEVDADVDVGRKKKEKE